MIKMLAENKMKVLISSPSLSTAVNVSGVSSVVLELSKALSERVEYQHVKLGSPQTGMPLKRFILTSINILSAIIVVIFSKSLIFHSNTALMPKSVLRDLFVIIAARCTGKKVLLHVHGGKFVETRPKGIANIFLTLLLRYSDTIVFLSDTERANFTAHTPLPDGKTIIAYNSIRMPQISSPLVCHEPLRLVFAGRLVREKGISVIIEVASQKYQTPFSLTIYGDGPLKASVLDAVSSCPNIRYGGIFDHDRWPEILKDYDVLVLPSTEPFEGMPMIILEGMSLGLVTIATKYGSIPELLGDNERGILVEPGDVDVLVNAIAMLASRRDLIKEMSESGIKFAKEKFDSTRNAQTILSIYRKIGYGKQLEPEA